MDDLVVIRDTGGIGDLIRMFPIIDALSRRPVNLTWYVPKAHADLCLLCPSVAEGRAKLAIVPWISRNAMGPLAREWGDLKQPAGHPPWTRVVDLHCPALIHEQHSRGKMSMSRIRCWAEQAGVWPLLAGCIRMRLAADTLKRGADWARGMKRPLIAIAASSASGIRTWRNSTSRMGRTGRLSTLIGLMRTQGWNPVIFHHAPVDLPGAQSVDPDIREQIARISQADAFVGPDSGLLHAACSLRIPSVALFGPTHPRHVLHLYDGRIEPLQGEWSDKVTRQTGCVRPCYGMPSAGYNPNTCRGQCIVLESLNESRVMSAVSGVLR